MKMLRLVAVFALLLAAAPLFAQEKTPEEREKALYDNIQKRLDLMIDEFDLEDWQVFYLDSIMVHDYTCMQQELRDMQDKKVENSRLYTSIQDKWGERIYQGFRRVLNDEQWKKYLRTGADREKRARDKRAADNKK